MLKPRSYFFSDGRIRASALCFVISSIAILGVMARSIRRTTPAPTPLSRLSDPSEILRTGELLGQRGNWVGARAYFEQAQQLFASAGNEPLRLRAHLDYLRASLEHISFQAASNQVDHLAKNPVVLKNPELLIRALAVRAETAFQFDLNLCHKTLIEIRELATQLNDPAWANRAAGDLGGIELHEGHYFSGVVHFQTALANAIIYDDVGAQMRYRSFMGEALVAAHQCSTATLFFESVIRLG
jgi:hypothetical protein